MKTTDSASSSYMVSMNSSNGKYARQATLFRPTIRALSTWPRLVRLFILILFSAVLYGTLPHLMHMGHHNHHSIPRRWNCDRSHPPHIFHNERTCSPRVALKHLKDWKGVCTPRKSRTMKIEPPNPKKGVKYDWGIPIPLEHRNLGGNECTGDQNLYNNFWMEHLDFTDPSLTDNCTYFPPEDDSGSALAPKQRIPKILHFIFGLQPNFGGYPFLFFHYMSIKVAHDTVRPDVIMFHYKYEPKGQWWEQAKKLVKLVKIEHVPAEIFGNPVVNVAHQADVLRMQILIKYGGIYLDSDLFLFRPVDALLHHETVMGKEDEHGLCNALIMSVPSSRFLLRWYDTYRTFNGSQWAEHSVNMPKRLAEKDKSDICVMPRVSFFYPSFYANHVEFVQLKDEYIFDNGYQYAYHASNHMSWKFIKTLSPYQVRTVDTSFNRLLRPFLDNTMQGNSSGIELFFPDSH